VLFPPAGAQKQAECLYSAALSLAIAEEFFDTNVSLRVFPAENSVKLQ